jgi:hypothetical protein
VDAAGVQEVAPLEMVSGIASTPEGAVWFHSGFWNNHGVLRHMQGTTRTFTTKDGLPEDAIRTLYGDQEGVLWLVSASGKLCRFDRAQQRFTQLPTPGAKFALNSCTSMFRDRRGSLWFGTQNGVVHYDGTAWSGFDQADGLPGKWVNGVCEDARGAIWLGTDKGLARLQRRPGWAASPTVTIVADRRHEVRQRLEVTGASAPLLRERTITALDDDPRARIDALPPQTAGRRVSFHFNTLDLNHRADTRQYRWAVLDTKTTPNALGEIGWFTTSPAPPGLNWSRATPGAMAEWTSQKPGKYVVAVQYVDQWLRYSVPTVFRMEIVPPWYLDVRIAGPTAAANAALLGWRSSLPRAAASVNARQSSCANACSRRSTRRAKPPSAKSSPPSKRGRRPTTPTGPNRNSWRA